MALVGQTITVVNKSGKVVSTSKHLINVFKDAKLAYLEKKAELQAARNGNIEPHPQVTLPPQPFITYVSDDEGSRATAHRTQKKRRRSLEGRKQSHTKSTNPRRYSIARGYSDGLITDDSRKPETGVNVSRSTGRRQGESAVERAEQRVELGRRNSDTRVKTTTELARRPDVTIEEIHAEDVDMDLAYGELPPALPRTRPEDEAALRTKMSTVNVLLEELHCLQFSATQMIKNLEQNPEAMAAVALTLAEISNLASKMAPGALMSLKGAFPAVVALLASPEFLIAAGVGVGITVVALGGYKIIKKIRPTKAVETESKCPPAALEPLIISDIDRIEHWRRGIANSEVQSVGTSVEGELMTPMAAMRLREDNVLPTRTAKSTSSKRESFKRSYSLSKFTTSTKPNSSAKDVQKKSEGKEDSVAGRKDASKAARHYKERRSSNKSDAAGSVNSERSSKSTTAKKNSMAVKVKEPSGLRLLFKKH